ncbi:MAG: diaminopimelate epimerase [Pseudoxanthomonas suwonensis]|nr:diaminopimelate epimerase [Pseudoxanthomonas suwonensis]
MTRAEPARLRFSKLHGAGNDFVLIDLRDDRSPPSPELCRALADRHTGVGCDQILTVSAARDGGAVAAYGIFNSDGSAAGQCGNGARCVAAWLQRDGSAPGATFALDSPAGRHAVQSLGDGHFCIAMGVPDFEPAALPLEGVERQDHYQLLIDGQPVRFGALALGNPHAVIEVDDVRTAPVAALGQALQAHPAFPDSVNVGFAQVLDAGHIALRVHERGAGETLACGSGACAAAAVLMQHGRVAREVAVRLPGGTLHVAWPDAASPILMSGPTAHVFDGEWLP